MSEQRERMVARVAPADGERPGGLVRLVAARMSSARAPLAAAGLVALLSLLGGAPLVLVVLGYLLVVGAAMLGPRRTPAERMAERIAAQAKLGSTGVPADLALVVDAVPDPVLLLDPDLGIVYQNAAAREAFGPVTNGQSARMRFRGPELRAFLDDVHRTGRRAVLPDYELPGRDRWFEVNAAPLASQAARSEAPSWLLVFREQTGARREARIRADFVANAGHELRTPLASMIGFIETLQGPARDDTEARARFLEIMSDQAHRMSRLVDDLMSLSRLERRARLRPSETVDLAALARHVAETARPAFEAEGVSIELDVPLGPVGVVGDRDELVQVIENLVVNALRYGGSGGRVRLSVSPLGRKVRLSVRDWGPGIAAAHLPRLTERFYRVDVETSRARKGTGLGLAIVKHILARHGSQLRIDSREGKGATFQFTLDASDELSASMGTEKNIDPSNT